MIRLNLTIGDGRMTLRGLTGEQASRLVAELPAGSYQLTCERTRACSRDERPTISADSVRRLAVRNGYRD